MFPRGGGVLWVETKTPKGTTQKERAIAQDEFRQRVELFGHKYRRVTTLDEGMDALKL